MPKNRPKTKKSPKKSPKKKSSRVSSKRAERKVAQTVKIHPVKSTYNEWLSKQVKTRSGRKEERTESPRSARPLDTFNEWMKNQRVKDSSSERKTSTEIPKTTYELWMAAQIAGRNKAGENETEHAESAESGEQVLSMSPESDEFSSRLADAEEIRVTVTGRNSGKSISTPVWFVFDEGNREGLLMPVQGSTTNWFKNFQSNGKLSITVGEKDYDVNATAETDSDAAQRVAEKFRAKYGEEDVKKFYPKIDAFVRFTPE